MANHKGTVLITGSNGGLGSAIVKQVASEPKLSGYFGLYAVRDAPSSQNLGNILSENTAHPHEVIHMDLSDLNSVRQVAKTINARVEAETLPPIQALVLNAGFQDFGKQAWTEDGLDKTFSANYLGHWLFTLLILRSMNKDTGRIVVVGSQSHE